LEDVVEDLEAEEATSEVDHQVVLVVAVSNDFPLHQKGMKERDGEGEVMKEIDHDQDRGIGTSIEIVRVGTESTKTVSKSSYEMTNRNLVFVRRLYFMDHIQTTSENSNAKNSRHHFIHKHPTIINLFLAVDVLLHLIQLVQLLKSFSDAHHREDSEKKTTHNSL